VKGDGGLCTGTLKIVKYSVASISKKRRFRWREGALQEWGKRLGTPRPGRTEELKLLGKKKKSRKGKTRLSSSGNLGREKDKEVNSRAQVSQGTIPHATERKVYGEREEEGVEPASLCDGGTGGVQSGETEHKGKVAPGGGKKHCVQGRTEGLRTYSCNNGKGGNGISRASQALM